MKKTISINIAGLIFYIEEDGYDKLKNYLNAIQKYFSTYEDSKEIISDIESRIAEKFLNKQKANDNQVISLNDVDELIKSMGTVADFEAIEEEEDLATSTTAQNKAFEETPSYTNTSSSSLGADTTRPKKLYRDTRRKLLGGVCAGIAHYFNTDPLLIRLFFLFIFIGLPAGGGILNLGDIFAPFSGIIFLVYIAFWVAFPGSDTLEEDKSIKKFYRDPDQKVIGGVAAGVAAYFGIDLGIVRFIWVLSILFFGSGLLLYFVLWAITPKANTLTEKMEMKGQPITLENIETNVKKALQPDQREETALTKLLLFPFRAIAVVFSGLTPFAKFLTVLLRIFAGLMLVLIGGSGLLALITGFFTLLGLGTWDWGYMDNDLTPFHFFLQEVSPTAYFFALLAAGVPLAVLAWAGVSLLTRENKFTPVIWQTMLGLFLAGLLGSIVFGTRYAGNFRKEGNVEKIQTYNMPALFDVNENTDDNFNNTSLSLEGYDEATIKLEQRFHSQGRSREDAENNAKLMDYKIVYQDSTLIFDTDFTISKNSKTRFRGQSLSMTMYVPYEKPFSMTRDFYDEFWGVRDKIEKDYDLNINDEEFKHVRWVMKKDSGLVCLNRPVEVEHDDNSHNDSEEYSSIHDIDNDISANLGNSFDESFDKRGDYVKQYDVASFQKIDISGAFVVRIQKGDKYKVEADGRQKDVERVNVLVENGKLIVKHNFKFDLLDDNDMKRIGITITMPTVESINLAGATVSKIDGFNELDNIDIDVAGASKAWVDIKAQKLDLSVAGASKIDLYGSVKTLYADLAGACKLDATKMEIQNADISAAGASKVDVGNIPNLKSNTSGFSRINK